MAKTIMVSDSTYERLTKIKKSGKYSYSELLNDLMDKPKKRTATERILKLEGTWKESKEDNKIVEEANEAWKKWEKTFV
ncbi:MAG: hypothetical protein COV47_05015 [Candidatus Diapherotrites archaeon CG11_big_fil_rev_8_21_14_0_20_37_9]|nr:MAG: hypothetical protein COV47_05015 [Candidatus Diapherotrites archaeon CG11_big_fil_rev_8_21_14_0_20_37_9]